MRISKFSLEKKKQIISESETFGKNIQDVCNKHKITTATFYLWRKQLDKMTKGVESDSIKKKPRAENSEIKTLKKLYISLSAHNYELAQFLNNQI